MKTISIAVAALALAALTGCATQQPGYYTAARVQDPYQWHTVEVAPADRGGQAVSYSEAAPASRVLYTTEPAYTTTTYVTQPVYVTAPAYYAPSPYYYPPVSIGLDFSFGRWWGGGGGRGWGHGGGYHRR